MAEHSPKLASLSKEERADLERALLKRQSGKCFICDDTIDVVLHKDQLDIDHIVPLAEDGVDDVNNFALTHSSCNRSKGASDLRVARRMAQFERFKSRLRSAAKGEPISDMCFNVTEGRKLVCG